MASSEYKILQQQASDPEEDGLPSPPFQLRSRLSKSRFAGLTLLLFTSLSFNAISVYHQLRAYPDGTAESATVYGDKAFSPDKFNNNGANAGLLKNIAIPFTIDTAYTSENRTIADEAWQSSHLVTYTGLVAVSEDWARSKNLPEAQRFPWDKSKGLYLLNGFHNMHCLHMLRRSTLETFDGKVQTIPYEHIAHCLNVLRDDIMCNADDTPRYTGRLNQQASAEHPTSGVGQTRLCRDWTLLEQWAHEHSACYKPINMSDAGFPLIERYKFCPNGERLWA